MWQYIYDASGTRVAKGSITVWPANCASLSDFTLTNLYLLDGSGNQVTELDSSGKWMHSNAWQGGHLTGTYDNIALHFTLSDPLGTKRVQANAQGAPEQNFFMLPWGNDFNNTFAVTSTTPTGGVAAPDATEHHFTGKERDTESGNDYFGARYFNSMTGRWLSPDWSAKEEPVPYAKLDNPQSLNLYRYLFNNPLSTFDPDGHVGAEEDPTYLANLAHMAVVAIANGMNAGDAMEAEQALQQAQPPAPTPPPPPGSTPGAPPAKNSSTATVEPVPSHAPTNSSASPASPTVAVTPWLPSAIYAKFATKGYPSTTPPVAPIPDATPVIEELPKTPMQNLLEATQEFLAGAGETIGTFNPTSMICISCGTEEFRKKMYPNGDPNTTY